MMLDKYKSSFDFNSELDVFAGKSCNCRDSFDFNSRHGVFVDESEIARAE